MASPFLGVDHFGVVVENLEAATHTYRDILGFPISGQEELPRRGLKVAFVDTGGTRLELIAATRDNSEISPFLAKRGEGLHHVCVRVASLQKALDAMQERGAQVVGAGIAEGAGGKRVAFIHPKGCHGVLLELVEYPSRSE